MKHLLTKLLCALSIHSFSTISTNAQTATVVCTRPPCQGVWHVDFKRHTMERIAQGAYE